MKEVNLISLVIVMCHNPSFKPRKLLSGISSIESDHFYVHVLHQDMMKTSQDTVSLLNGNCLDTCASCALIEALLSACSINKNVCGVSLPFLVISFKSVSLLNKKCSLQHLEPHPKVMSRLTDTPCSALYLMCARNHN